MSVKTPLTSEQPLPRQFFTPVSGQPSPVIDFYDGNIYNVGDILQHDQALVVMYYAPWCTKSRAARMQYERAAIYFSGEVSYLFVS